MKQLTIDPTLIVPIPLTGVASVLHPTVFHEGDAYCCILGEDPVQGVFGCGNTPEEAVKDWDETLRIRLEEAQPGDEVVGYVKYVLSKLPPPAHVQEFYDQFRPSRRR